MNKLVTIWINHMVQEKKRGFKLLEIRGERVIANLAKVKRNMCDD